MPDMKYDLICPECGSHNVSHEAWMIWDADTQEWELDHLIEGYSWCTDCDSQITPEECVQI